MKLFVTVIFLCLISPFTLGADTVVIYPKPQSEKDIRTNDLIALLKHSLEITKETHGPYRLQTSDSVMTESRQLAALRQGQGINIVWSSTSKALEKKLLPIRIPLRKGLLGYRISLIDKANQESIDKIKTLADLKSISIGQGRGWGDVDIYKTNDIEVQQAPYNSLFKMVANNRFDLFPRGINEIFDEHNAQAKVTPNLAIEKNLMIVYAWPYYFFTNPKDKAIADRIEYGLRKMIADGSFNKIFLRYHGNSIKQANVHQRRIIRINNNLLPTTVPLDDKSLWFDPLKDL